RRERGARGRGARARLRDRGAVPAARVPRALRHPGVEDHRPRPRRRRAVRARAAAGRMSLLLTNAHVVTMDDEGSEYPDGWVLLANGRIEAVGGSIPPESSGGGK